MIKVGITGGIGSGKTTVCKVWKQLGAYIIDADELAKKIMVSSPAIKQELVETFGAGAFNENGTLNRTFLAKQAFGEGRADELNAIVHPRMPEKVSEIARQAEAQNYPMLVYEAALLLENIKAYSLDYVVLVLATENRRIRWVEERDDVSAGLVVGRIENQANFEKFIPTVDFVIRNQGSLTELEQTAANLYRRILGPK